MKRTPSVLLAVFCAALVLFPAHRALAQATAKPPTQLTYQGFLTDGNGLPFGNTAPVNKTVLFRIYDALTGGTIKWSSQQVVTVDKGYFSALLGQGSAVGTEPFSADLTGVFTGSATVSDRYLELTADGTTIAPRLRFLPAPYALLAKSATDLVDPLTGSNSLSISGGNLTVGGSLSAANLSGNGANLTSLNASQVTTGTLNVARIPDLDAGKLTTGTLANARTTATSDATFNTIVSRDNSGNSYFYGNTGIGFVNQGLYGDGVSLALRATSGGSTYFQTYAGARTDMFISSVGNVGIGNTAPSAKLEVSGGVVANSFKITGTPTLVLYNISRGSMYVGSPIAGVTLVNGGGVTANGRQNPNDNSAWWRSDQTSWGTMLHTATFVVPAGEQWEVAYTCQYLWNTDDSAAITWTLNDAVMDDHVTGSYQQSAGPKLFNHTFILGAGTQVLRVKAIIGGGSGSDYIYFPWHTPSHLVVRKYKSN